MSKITFDPITEHNLYGYRATIPPWSVELVRAEPGTWDVYVVRGDRRDGWNVVSLAQFTREHRALSRYYYDGSSVSYHRARRLARLIAEGLAS